VDNPQLKDEGYMLLMQTLFASTEVIPDHFNMLAEQHQKFFIGVLERQVKKLKTQVEK